MTWDLFHPDGHIVYGSFKSREDAARFAWVLDAGFIPIPAIENTEKAAA